MKKIEAVLYDLEFHAKETSRVARLLSQESLQGLSAAAKAPTEVDIMKVANANLIAVQAQYWYLKTLMLVNPKEFKDDDTN
jgi:hypothetical protein